MMKTLEIMISGYESVEVTIDNHLVGYAGSWDCDDVVFRFPLPEGNWKIINEDYVKWIKLGDFS